MSKPETKKYFENAPRSEKKPESVNSSIILIGKRNHAFYAKLVKGLFY